ncbi:MAG TPA: phosphatidate cytidylyltransferase [Ignavibacteriaceae bacterium]|nr:phosphatidate cytidylyltransferase [Ignavibacteriaceae bacterium]
MSKNNTAVRVIVSVVTIPVILLLCYLGRIPFLVFISFIGIVSFFEYTKLAQKKDASPLVMPGILAVMALLLNSYFHYVDYFTLILIITMLIVLIELFRNKGSSIFNIGVTFLGIFYIGLFSSSILELREILSYNYDYGAWLIISIFVTIWVCDSAAFFGGVNLGKHKLFPRVSPNKSWEGAIFGFVFSVIAMLAAKYILLDFLTWIDSAAIGIIIGTIGQLGDLTESLIKRDAGVKDSSNLIPGHGGIFDRFDSLIVASPAVYLYLKLFTF